MAFTQTTFLGASIRSATTAMGWGVGQPSSITAQLVEDPLNGDSFDPPEVGTPVTFQFGDLVFEGLLQSHNTRNGPDGKPVYDVTVVDPREILAGTQIILSGYNGSTGGIPNLINVYGWHEADEFGSSLVNAAGMPWKKVLQALNALTKQPNQTTYGGPLQFMGESYSLDLSDMPVPPIYYRVGGTYASLLDVIAAVCEDGGRDFYAELKARSIKIKTVNRTNAPPLGTIQSIVTNNLGNTVTRGNYGTELRNEITSSFLVGGEVTTMYVARDDDIKSFWGYNVNGDPILSQDYDLKLYDKQTLKKAEEYATANSITLQQALDEEDSGGVPRFQPLETIATQRFDLNATPIADIVGSTRYRCTEFELRLAQAGYEAWSLYMQEYRTEFAQQINILAPWKNNQNPTATGPQKHYMKWDLLNDSSKHVKTLAQAAAEADAQVNAMTVFDFVRGYADEFMGRKFFIPLPDVETFQDPETLERTYSYEVTDAGYVPESEEPPQLSELNEEIFKVPDGRFKCFVEYRFSPTELLLVDLNSISPQGAIFENDILFAEAQAATKLIRSPQTGCIVTVPGAVKQKAADVSGGLNLAGPVGLLNPDELKNLKTSSHIPGIGVAPAAYKPSIVAVPLKSNILTYGPWYVAGAAGKVKFEQDPSLTPWNYSGFTYLNLAGNARVQTAVTNQQKSESGMIERAEAPTISLGETLHENGPNCAGIDLQMGDAGVTTVYRFQTFTPRFGVFNKTDAERFKRLALGAQNFNKALKSALRDKQVRNESREMIREFMDKAPKQFKQKSPHEVIVSFNQWEYNNASGDVRQMVSTSTAEEAMPMLNANDDELYRRTAMMSVNGLFRPFSTDAAAAPSSVLMARYVEPEVTGDGIPNVDTLSPFSRRSDTEVFLWGDTYPGSVHAWRYGGVRQNVRAIGLKLPQVGVGYGLAWNGDVAPTGENGQWPTDISRRQDLHKAGPFDWLWDEKRGVWTCHDILKGKTLEEIPTNGSGLVNVNVGGASGWDLYAVNWQLPDVSGNTRVYVGYVATEHKWGVISIGVLEEDAPDPDPDPTCNGTCTWRWDLSTEVWNLIENACTEPTTTTSTSSTTTSSTSTPAGGTTTSSSTTTTTSTTASCGCTKPTRCGTSAGEELVTDCSRSAGDDPICRTCNDTCSWNWDDTEKKWVRSDESQCLGDNCLCEEPQLCGSGDCTTTKTACIEAGAVDPQPHCGGSTTTTTSGPTTSTTTTTTTTSLGCSQGCKWEWEPFAQTWIQLSNNCLAECPCSAPVSPGSDCGISVTGCQQTTTTTCSPRSCSGECEWRWQDAAGYWLLYSFGCFEGGTCPSDATCTCARPAEDGECGATAYTDCGFKGGTTTTLAPGSTTTTSGPTNPPTTTTPEPGVCEGRRCFLKWDGAEWGLVLSECLAACTCPGTPGYAGEVTGECAAVPCSGTPTTTTTTTTTSTTTTTTTTPVCQCFSDPPGVDDIYFECFLKCELDIYDNKVWNQATDQGGCAYCPTSCPCTVEDLGVWYKEGDSCDLYSEGATIGGYYAGSGGEPTGICKPTTTTTTSTTTTTTTTNPLQCNRTCLLECLDNVWEATTAFGYYQCPGNCPCIHDENGNYFVEGTDCTGYDHWQRAGTCKPTTTTTTTPAPTTAPPTTAAPTTTTAAPTTTTAAPTTTTLLP